MYETEKSFFMEENNSAILNLYFFSAVSAMVQKINPPASEIIIV